MASTIALGLAVGTAQAEPINWEGTVTLSLADFPNGVFTGGGVATINDSSGGPGHLGNLRLASSRGVAGTDLFTLVVTDPDSLVNNGIQWIQFVGIHQGTGTLGPISGAITSSAQDPIGTMPLRGLVNLCLVAGATCTGQIFPLPLTQPTPTFSTQTKGVGIGGVLTVSIGGGLMITIEAAPWQIKTASVQDEITTPVNKDKVFITKTFQGFAHGPASATSTTATLSGVVQMVSPAQVVTNLPSGSNAKLGVGVTLLVHFIPEPGLLVLLGSGVAGLALLGRKRLRK